jgi:hypothetical protein
MRNTISKAMIAGVAALSLAGSVFATTEPATAAGFWRGGGGFHGGGWHGGGWHGGGRGWNGGGGWGWGGPAVIGGLAAGALLAAPYYYGGYGNGYGYGYGYGNTCTGYSPMYDAYGNYIGQQLVNVC